jgi:cytochrome c556
MRSLAIVALLAFGGSLAGVAPYDSTTTKDVMHANVAALSAINKALETGDWVAVANGFLQFAQNAQKALQSAPPKGDAQAWAHIWEDVLFTAYRGVGAAGEKDAAKAKAALDQIVGDRNTGHSAFKG